MKSTHPPNLIVRFLLGLIFIFGIITVGTVAGDNHNVAPPDGVGTNAHFSAFITNSGPGSFAISFVNTAAPPNINVAASNLMILVHIGDAVPTGAALASHYTTTFAVTGADSKEGGGCGFARTT